MLLNDKVIWSEGLLLQPQHFQQQERYMENLVTTYYSELRAHPWGIQQLKIDERLLAQGKIAIVFCRGILPDGTAFDIPHRDRAPLPLDIPEGLSNKKVYLALPLHDTNSCRYSVESIDIADSNKHSSRSTSIQIGKLSFRLILEDDNLHGYSYITLIRISESRQDRSVILEEQFIPPCINIKTVSYIERFILELQGILRYRRTTLLRYLGDFGAGSVAEIYDFILLQLISRYEPIVSHFSEQKKLHPEALYRTLMQLLHELMTFSGNQTHSAAEKIVYLHNNLQHTFQPLINELRKSLSVIFEGGAIAIKLESRQPGTWVAELADKALLNKNSFILAVHADTAPEMVRNFLPTQIKIAPLEEIRDLVHRALPGIELIPLGAVPRQMPFNANFIYFSLNNKHSLWSKLEQSAGLAFHLSGDFPGLKLELWIIRNNK